MSLRARIAWSAAGAVALAIVLVSVALYVATARTLNGSVDTALRELARDLRRPSVEGPFEHGPRPGRFGGAGGYVQVVDADGRVVGPPTTESDLPVDAVTLAVANGQAGATIRTVEVDGEPVRVLTVPVRGGFAAQVARPLGEVAAALYALRRQLLLGGLIGVGLAAGLGLLVARRAVQPIHELTDLAEDVAATQDLTRRIDMTGTDEIGRLARTFNAMLAALEQARLAQQQLVADASHELRTPLTSLRTNIELLAEGERLDAADRRALVADVVLQLEEFGRLVSALVELARGEQPVRATVPLRLDELVAGVVERSRRFAGAGRVLLDARPTVVDGEADRLERAVANLVDNALKYGQGPVEVSVRDHRVVVRDHGPGIAQEHLPHVFDRFYRAPEARSAPGSGLGLSIVRQAVEAHGGQVTAANHPDGGAVFTITLPTQMRPALAPVPVPA